MEVILAYNLFLFSLKYHPKAQSVPIYRISVLHREV